MIATWASVMVGSGPFTDLFDRHVELQGRLDWLGALLAQGGTSSMGERCATPDARPLVGCGRAGGRFAGDESLRNQIVATAALAVLLDYESRSLAIELVLLRVVASRTAGGPVIRRADGWSDASAVELPDQPQALERQQVVGLVDRGGERGHEMVREAAGRDHRRLDAEFLAQPRDDAVDLAGEAVDDARAHGVSRRLADQRARLAELDLPELGGATSQRLERYLDAGRDDAAQVLALARDDVVGDRGAKVHDDARALEPRPRGDRVDEAVRPELAGVVHPNRHAGTHARGRRRRASRGRGNGAPSPTIRGRARERSRRAPIRRCLRRRGRAAPGGCAAPPRARPRSTCGRSRSASARRSRRREPPQSGSACCRRRRRGARGRIIARSDAGRHREPRGPASRTPSSIGSAASASARRSPAGVARAKSSSSSGISTKRRASTCSCGTRSRSERCTTSPSSSTSTSIARGPWRTPPGALPSSRSSALQASSSSSGSRSVSMRTQALRNVG